MGQGIYIDQFVGAMTKGPLRQDFFEDKVELGVRPNLIFEDIPEALGWHVSYGKQHGYYLWWGQRISREWEPCRTLVSASLLERVSGLFDKLPDDQRAMLHPCAHWIVADDD